MVTEERRYEVLAVLGRGGFGTVYHARFLGEGGFSKEVALKVLNPEVENVAEVASRLRDEARVLGLVRHRAIVAVDRLTVIDGRWTVVMEYVDGHDLSQILTLGAFPPGPALEIAAEVAGALNAAYSRTGPGGQPLRLLHRDLKPSNVRITPFGEVKVLDFGIARAEFLEREAKTRSLAFGTPEYMSPERLDFAEDGPPSDIYALGAVLYELLVGKQLGRSSANPATHSRRLEGAKATLRQGKVPGPVVELLDRMLCFDEKGRPTASDVERRAAALARSVGGVTLREWVDDLGSAISASAEAADEITGSILVERPDAGQSNGETVWERVKTREPQQQRSHTPPGQLVAAETGSTPAKPDVHRAVGRRDFEVVPVPLPVPKWRWRLAALLIALTVSFMVLLSAKLLPSGTSAPTAPMPPQEEPPPHPEQAAQAAQATAVSPPLPTEPAPSNDAPIVAPAPPSTVSESETNTVTSKGAATKKDDKVRAVPTPTPTADGTVGVVGDAKQVSLRAGQASFKAPGTVPPGQYDIWAVFEGEDGAIAGTLRVESGRAYTISCSSDFGKCGKP